MVHKRNRIIALLTAAVLLLQCIQVAATAQEDTELSGTTPSPVETAPDSQPEASDPASEAEWEGTGALNPDGTPVTADQGDVLQPQVPEVTQPPAAPASYVITLDLDGGQVNNLQSSGWNQSSYEIYQWKRTVSETEAGSGVALTVDELLGGLLPGAPYRAGYKFAGWKIGETDNSGEYVTIHGDTEITACWEIENYQVEFQQDTDSLWQVQVPYGATLWTENSAPWEDDGVSWEMEQAQVEISIGGNAPEMVTVTRHADNDSGTWYSFTLGGVYYFTYGGTTPTKSGQHFVSWKILSGGSGFTVTGNAVFTAQFQAETAYVFNIYYYYENGTKAAPTYSTSLSEANIKDGILSFTVEFPEIPYYVAQQRPKDGVTWIKEEGNVYTVNVEIEQVFSTISSTNFLALTVIYSSAEISYKVEYYQQKDQGTDYTLVGTLENFQNVKYGSNVIVPDRPTFDGVSFQGFQLRVDSQEAVVGGVLLREGMPNVFFAENDGKLEATVKVYYDRASYFIYFQTGTTEVQLDPKKIQYGTAIPSLEADIASLTRAGYESVTVQDVTWYYLGENGEPQKLDGMPAEMPAYDLYAVINWTPATTSIRLVYWVESRNAAGYQNAYTTTVNDINTESVLTVSLEGGVTISGGGLPVEYTADSGFSQLILGRYGDEEYETFFSYSPEQTKASAGNVANAQATGTGNVVDDVITGNEYQVKVSGDGTTTINIYYTRNLYTLEFVLARMEDGKIQIANSTPGTFKDAGWQSTGSTSFTFADFANGVTTTETPGQSYGGLQVQKTYRLSGTVDSDPRAPVGRYGTKTISGFQCYVYTLTARFEADITALWPTSENLGATYSVNSSAYQYVSMGTSSDSYYRNVFAATIQKNILNAYSTMDRNVVAIKPVGSTTWSATPDTGNGTTSHQMVAYWYNEVYEYRYYFFYETRDASITPEDSRVQAFSTADAKQGNYEAGSLIKTSADQNQHVFVYDETFSVQYSSSDKGGQNQPARQGFVSRCKISDGQASDKGGDIYFFYTREEYKLDIENTNERYNIPESFLTQDFSCLSQYGEGITTLRQLGWEGIDAQGLATIRYGGALTPLAEEEIINWLTDETGGGLKYPHPSAGENQYYFRMWYRNLMQTVPVDWTPAGGLQTMTGNTTLYAGWFTPRYTTTYVLNGGTWKDEIQYTLTTYTDPEDGTLFIYYPHQTAEAETDVPMYWYIQTKEEDRLFVQNLYTCDLSEVAIWDEATQHYIANGEITSLEELLAISELHNLQSRLVNKYYCYMGQEGMYNHEKYININVQVNTVLPEPVAPERAGYTFAGWYYFGPEQGEKVYLGDVLTDNQSLASYGEKYVYLNHVADAYLLHLDEQGRLFYYSEQIGYRFSYANMASAVSQDLRLYAAWESQGDATGQVYHLVPVSKAENVESLTPKGDAAIPVNEAEKITIGGIEYYILEEYPLDKLYTGNTYLQTAWEYCTDKNGIKWLPMQAEIPLYADERTPTVTEDSMSQVTGNTYRIRNANGSYTYYAFFVYEPTDEITYRVYTIDLSVAVAEGALASYQDGFDRTFVPEATAPYFLGMKEYSVTVQDDDFDTAMVVENAPTVSGYSVYQDWSQTLQLQRDAKANNIFFYYVQDGTQVSYSVTFYLMTGGGYSSQNAVTISGIPAVTGEIISLADMAGFYSRLLTMAQTYSTYANSENEGQTALYNRYRNMKITFNRNGEQQTFTVEAGDTDSLNLENIAYVPVDYYVDSWSPTGSSLVVSDGVQVAVYLATAHLIIQKVDTAGMPLAGAEFTLERLVPDAQGSITVNGASYEVDSTFPKMTAVSGEDGKAWFHNLSARVFEDGRGYMYRLQETKAPEGYHRLTSAMYVNTPYTVEDTTHYTVTYTVVNSGLLTMPESGVLGGFYPITFLGCGLMAGALLWWGVMCKKKKTDCRFCFREKL